LAFMFAPGVISTVSDAEGAIAFVSLRRHDPVRFEGYFSVDRGGPHP
jgi:hypothetical protein